MGLRNSAGRPAALPLMVAAGTALAAFVFLAAAGARSSAPGAAPVPAPPVSVHHPPAGLVTRVSSVRHLPVRTATIPGISPALAFGGGWVWVPGAEGLERISPDRFAASTSSQFYGTCGDAQVGYGIDGVWVTEGDCGNPGAVYEFGRRAQLRRSIRLPAAPVGIGVRGGRVWVTTMARRNSRWAVVQIDPASGRATAVGGAFDSPGDPAARYGAGPIVSVGGGRFWTIANDGGVVLMTPQPSGRVTGTVVGAGATSTGLAFGGGAIWAGLDLDVVRLDPRTGEATGIDLRPRSSPVAVAFGQGTVWIATSGYEVYEFRPGSKSMTQVARLPFVPATMIDAGGFLWATDGQTLARIGPLTAR